MEAFTGHAVLHPRSRAWRRSKQVGGKHNLGRFATGVVAAASARISPRDTRVHLHACSHQGRDVDVGAGLLRKRTVSGTPRQCAGGCWPRRTPTAGCRRWSQGPTTGRGRGWTWRKLWKAKGRRCGVNGPISMPIQSEFGDCQHPFIADMVSHELHSTPLAKPHVIGTSKLFRAK